MTTQTTFQKVNDIFQCALTLSDGSDFIIPVREDGYIHATKLCQAVGKRMTRWTNNKETQELIKNFDSTKNGASQLLEIYMGTKGKYEKGTWIHPDLGLHLAQWCSPSFSLQVSKWIKELIFTSKVEIGNENVNEEITNQLKEKIKDAEDMIIAYEGENKKLMKKYNKLYQTHQAYLKRKELYKLKEGSCVYLVNMLGMNDPKDTLRIKVGQTGNITNRVSGFRTSNPFCKLLCVMYTQQNVLIETNMKLRYEKELHPNNSEFISGIPVDILINDLQTFADSLRIPYSIETQEELDKFNRHIVPIDEIEQLENEMSDEPDIDEEKFKRCGGFTHTTEESRIVSLDNFFKNAGNKDGVARICKECFLVGQYGDDRKKRKVVVVPKYDVLTHKWCNRCENAKERKFFNKDVGAKDGLNANCKECKADQKTIYNEKKKKEKEKTNEVAA